MNPRYDFIISQLKKHNIRLSHRRLKVLEYLCNNLNHPTVDQIYNNLHKDIPTLSKTTIYNTLHTLIDLGLVRIINIEDNETRYDIITEDHGHFKCEVCGKIFNFDVDFTSFTSEELSGFKIRDRNLYFKGICQKCLFNKNDS
ncbi:Fur family transcriptional regulator [Dethiobacter alkaliphilus]|uniref:Ferric uptake regulator, Fur family n=1 Tax=Dethiobacter alkaliphilus AHT 1 TaxID=555088 RepID=C0GFD8_DETAL|nr:Fur family transcriptional regulator [Dethiobacter alkaliphilus]EEG77898.1 ferric uptake regulator, Fur family [Dethiobacter alkaliphilus AHT 1]